MLKLSACNEFQSSQYKMTTLVCLNTFIGVTNPIQTTSYLLQGLTDTYASHLRYIKQMRILGHQISSFQCSQLTGFVTCGFTWWQKQRRKPRALKMFNLKLTVEEKCLTVRVSLMTHHRQKPLSKKHHDFRKFMCSLPCIQNPTTGRTLSQFNPLHIFTTCSLLTLWSRSSSK
jgi:hypothetical protein